VLEERDLDLIALDESLEKLAALHERQARIVELRFFGGLTLKEVAECLGVSPRTVDGDWSMARAWLRRELREVS
jgi:RNA polymerase sigma factor (sigma-70 family)